jgi:hypothetical protein
VGRPRLVAVVGGDPWYVSDLHSHGRGASGWPAARAAVRAWAVGLHPRRITTDADADADAAGGYYLLVVDRATMRRLRLAPEKQPKDTDGA